MANSNLESYLISCLKDFFQTNLQSIYLEGSYGAGDEIPGYSDVDVLIFTNVPVQDYPIMDFENLDIQVVDRLPSYEFSPINAIKFKYRTKLIYGEDKRSNIPDLTDLLHHDFGSELQQELIHATKPDSPGYILRRKPRKWGNYIINMADLLAIAGGKVVHKHELPQVIRELYPDFTSVDTIEFALSLRKPEFSSITDTQVVLQLNESLTKFLAEFEIITST